MPTLCLNMIVKNEMENLDRCLSAVAPYVTCWVIGDTGSTDGTQEFIEQFFSKRGIPGELHSFPFENFAQARNEALERARASKLKFDYILFTDADMEFVAHDPNFANTLKHSAYKLLQRAGVSYWNLRLLRRSTPAHYKGVTHEFLDILAGTTENLENASYIDHGTGANRFEKYDRDARLLTSAIAAEVDPGMIARYTFYLANTLRDSGQKEAALDAYKKRAEQGHWQQEVFISLLNAAKIKEELSYSPDEVLAAYEQATKACPSRAEALHAAARFCRAKNLFKEGYDAAKRGLAIKYPTDALFVEDWVYEFGLLDELAINAYWCGKHAEAADACDQLLNANKIPTGMRARVEANRRYAVERLAEVGIPQALHLIAHRDQLFGPVTPSDRNWMKLWMSAREYRESGDEEKFKRTALAAFQKRPRQAEPLYDLARYFRENGRYDESVVFSEQGLAVYESTDELTIANLFCIVGLHEELSIAANYSGNPDQKRRGFAACDWLSLARCVPAPQRSLARSNLRFYAGSADAMLPTLRLRQMPFQAPTGLRSASSSIARRGQNLFVAQQCLGHVEGSTPRVEEGEKRICEKNFLLEINFDFELRSCREMSLTPDLSRFNLEAPNVFRDLRLFAWQDALWCSAAVRKSAPLDGVARVFGRINGVPNGTCGTNDWSVLDPQIELGHELSWVPLLHSAGKGELFDELRFVCSFDPTIEVDAQGNTVARHDADIMAEHFRGASQSIPFGNGHLVLIRESRRAAQEDRQEYQHRFVWLDASGKLRAVGRPFYFLKRGAEFASGIAWHPDDQRILISFVDEDGVSWLADVGSRCVQEDLYTASPFSSAFSLEKNEVQPASASPDLNRLAPAISFLSLAPYLRAADSPQDRRDLSKVYDSELPDYLNTDRGRGLPQIHCFYEVLDERAEHRTLRAATRSMRAAGHPVRVWSYAPSKLQFLREIGVELRDAADVIPRQFFDRVLSRSEIRYFSDIFRYAVLYEFGGLWMDGDVVMLRPFAYNGDYFFNLQWRDGGKGHYICGNVMYARAFSPHMRALYEQAVSRFSESQLTEFGDIGPKLLSEYILSSAGAELRCWIRSPMFFNSIDWTETNLFEQPLSSLAYYLNDERVFGVHLWNARTHSITERPSGSLLSILSNPEERLPSLSDLFDRFPVDRNRLTGNRHFYARVYDALLGDRRFALSQLVEIGAHHAGQSVEAWRAYFPFCNVISVRPDAFSNPGGGLSEALPGIFADDEPSRDTDAEDAIHLDAVVDNGTHASLDQQFALATLFPVLAPGGWYFIESLDWQPGGESENQISTTKKLLENIRSNGRPTTTLDPAGIESLVPWFDKILFFDSLYELGRAGLTGGLVAIKKAQR